MIATLINAAAVIIGSLIGLIGAKKISEKYESVVYISIGMITLVIGMNMAFKSGDILFIIFSLILGGFIGTALKIEDRIHNLGKKIGEKTGNNDHNFAAGFLNASVLFCVGAMAIVGSLKAGINHEYQILYTKSVMDGFMAIMFSAVFGLGVLFSAATVLVYQGTITLLSGLLAPYISETIESGLEAYGGILIMMIGINLLDLKKIKTANFLPGLVLIVIFILAKEWIASLI